MEITINDLKKMDKDSYILLDIRDTEEAQKNPVENSWILSANEIETREFDPHKKIVVICAQGTRSIPVVTALKNRGYDALSLQGGYVSIAMETAKKRRSSDFFQQAERSIIKIYRKKIWSKFTKAIHEYQLINEGDSIAVCISGGKDSMLMAKCFQELKRHSPISFDVKYIVMDPGYSPANRIIIEDNAKELNIPIEIFESTIFDTVFHIEKSPCYVCARMRRGFLYNYAKEIGCNKIALGHHYDDVIETTLLSMLYGGQIQTMMPKLHSKHFKGMQLIRPLYLIREDDIKAWAKYNDLYFIQCACKFTTAYFSDPCLNRSQSKRMEIKNLIKQIKTINPFVEANIFRSVENVSLKAIIAYKDDEKKYHFLDTYDNL